ncbi:MAG: metallophosphoesterase family protein, partial [Candidatus Aenigmarchaeota archaeon]|nr:metallophosphoesterase family protein [Candidatus Aenigmarchaeota archaeon]
HGKMGNIEIEGRKLIFVHDPIFAKGMASLNLYDAVFYGHTHEAKVEKLGNTLLANPGEVMGLKGKITFGVYDVESNKIDIKEVL